MLNALSRITSRGCLSHRMRLSPLPGASFSVFDFMAKAMWFNLEEVYAPCRMLRHRASSSMEP